MRKSTVYSGPSAFTRARRRHIAGVSHPELPDQHVHREPRESARRLRPIIRGCRDAAERQARRRLAYALNHVLERFRRFVRVLPLLAAATAASCHRAPDPGRVRQLLAALPGASDMGADRNTVAYNLDERYPASATITALNRNLESNGCTVTNGDPFNPEPGLPFNKWMEYTPEGGGAPELLWTGAWQCKPSDDVVVFAFRTRRPTPDAPAPAFAVKGAYYPGEQVVAMRNYLAGSGSRNLLFGTERRAPTRSVSYETCSVCGSVRKKENANDWVVVYDAPSESHEHRWESGVSTGATVADGQVILVRRKVDLESPAFAYAAFILENQRFEPQERTDARWVLRTDGGSVLDPKNAAVKTGVAQDQRRIVFGPFSVPWSAGGKNAGFVYYARSPGGGGFSDDYELAITNLKSLDGLDAADSQFTYRFFPAH